MRGPTLDAGSAVATPLACMPQSSASARLGAKLHCGRGAGAPFADRSNANRCHPARADRTLQDMTAVRVADFDPELFEHVADPEAAAAGSLAESEWLEVGPWAAESSGDHGYGHFGILLLEGTVIRRVALGPGDGLELLGPGDVGRPWVTFGAGSSIRTEARWRVHQRARVAHLDRRFAVRMSPWPEVASALMDRLIRRQRFLAMHLAVSQMPRLDTRLRVLFWYLADRWGKVT